MKCLCFKKPQPPIVVLFILKFKSSKTINRFIYGYDDQLLLFFFVCFLVCKHFFFLMVEMTRKVMKVIYKQALTFHDHPLLLADGGRLVHRVHNRSQEVHREFTKLSQSFQLKKPQITNALSDLITPVKRVDIRQRDIHQKKQQTFKNFNFSKLSSTHSIKILVLLFR